LQFTYAKQKENFRYVKIQSFLGRRRGLATMRDTVTFKPHNSENT